MKPVITAFADSPDEGQGLARDMRVRWALEEAQQAYDVKLVSFDEMKRPDYRRLQPFGQIPAYQEGDLVLFESGAILLHLGARSPALLPEDPNARARAVSWLFAALNTVEPPIVQREEMDLVERDKPWYRDRIGIVDERIRARLDPVARRLTDAEWLEGEFTVGDLMMVMVLRRLEGTGIVESYPVLSAYVARGEARPAYQRAFAAQKAVFTRRHG